MIHKVLVITSALFVAFFNYGVLNAYGILFTATLEKFHEGRAKTSLVNSILVGMSLGAGVFGGYLIKRFSLKVVFLAGSVLLPLGFSASFFASSVSFLVVSVGIVSGAGISFTYVSAVVVVSSVIPEKHKTTALSIQSVACGAPGVILPYLFTWLTETYGLSGTFLLFGGWSLNNLAIAILFSNITFKEPEGVEKQLKEDISVEISDGTQTIQSVSKAIKDTELDDTLTDINSNAINAVKVSNGTSEKLSRAGQLTSQSDLEKCSDVESVSESKTCGGSKMIIYIIFLVTNAFVMANISGIHAVFQDVGLYKGLSKEQTLTCIAAFNIVSTLGRFLPFVFQKTTENPFISPVVASMSGVVGQMLVLMTSHYYAILTGYALTGLSDGGTSSSAPVVIFKILNQESQAIGFGLVLTLIGVLATGSGPLYGAMYDATNSYAAVLLVTASIFAFGILVFTSCFILFQPPCCCQKKVVGSEKVLDVYAVENHVF